MATHSTGACEAISGCMVKYAHFATVAVLFIPASVWRGGVTVFGYIWVYCYGFVAGFIFTVDLPLQWKDKYPHNNKVVNNA